MTETKRKVPSIAKAINRRPRFMAKQDLVLPRILNFKQVV